MVQITSQIPLNSEGYIDVDGWLLLVHERFSQKQSALIESALNMIKTQGHEQFAYPKLNAYCQGIEMGAILFGLRADYEAITAALLYPLMTCTMLDNESLLLHTNQSVVSILKGALEMSAIRDWQGQSGNQVEHLRRMLLAMIEDVRVVLVKLADRVCLLREAKHWPEIEQKTLANEILDIYAPLANRLGIGQLKWEMEDRAFSYLHAEDYKTIAKSLDERRQDRETYIANIKIEIEDKLKAQHVAGDVSGRAKHIYSICKKMQKKHLDFGGLFDIRAFRILVDDIPACYAALGCIHSLWTPIPKEFSDYIATPKPNGYQSIHTVVMGPEGKTLEVQIRTHEMHEASEMGVAAHWRYKEGMPQDESYEARIQWMRSLLEWQEELAETDNVMETFRSQVVDERIYVFTPGGDVLDLPRGSTPLDFAYQVHTMVGHRFRGAKVGGKIVPITYKLKTGEQVEVLTKKEPQPSVDWLRMSEGYCKSPRTRSKIQAWFRHQNRDQNIQSGKDIIYKALETHQISDADDDLNGVAKKLHFKSLEDLYVAVATGHARVNHVVNLVLEKRQIPIESNQPKVPTQKAIKPVKSELSIVGVDNIMSHMAGCCRPIKGDDIIGYITQGNGVSIHRVDCKGLKSLRAQYPERIVEVSWGQESEVQKHPVEIEIHIVDRVGFLKDLTALLANESLSVHNLSTYAHKKRQTTTIKFTVSLDDKSALTKLLSKIKQLSGVTEVFRA